MKYLMSIVLIGLMPFSILAQEPRPVEATKVEDPIFRDFIRKGDEQHFKYDEKGALAFYLKAYDRVTKNAMVLERLSRTYLNLGEELGHENPQGVKYFDEASKYARLLEKAFPNNIKAELYLGMIKGYLITKVPHIEKAEVAREIQEHAVRVLKREPENPEAHLVLAVLYREIARLDGFKRMLAGVLSGGLPKANFSNSLYHFKQADRIRPRHVSTHYGLGLAYVRMKKFESAIKIFEKIDKLPITDHLDPQLKRLAKRRLRQSKEEIEKRKRGKSNLFQSTVGKSYLKGATKKTEK